jgi:hypothetical protein
MVQAATIHAADPPIQVLSPAHLRHVPSPDHVAELVRETASQLGLRDASLPHMVFIYVPLGAASVEYLAADVALYVQAVAQHAGPIYEIWMMGDTLDGRTVLGIATALNMRFQLGLSHESLKAAQDAICRRHRDTVSVKSLRSGH